MHSTPEKVQSPIQEQIDRITTAVGAAYDAVEAKGGTVPQSETVAGLAEAIGSIPTGGSENWELIASGEMAEAAALTITKDADGAALALRSAQIIIDGATSMAKSTTLRFDVGALTDGGNYERWPVELAGDNKTDNANIRAVYVAEQNKIPTLYAEIPASTFDWATSALKAQFAKKDTRVDNVSTYSFEPLTATINRIYVGNYMGNGILGVGCKYQIWGVRA